MLIKPRGRGRFRDDVVAAPMTPPRIRGSTQVVIRDGAAIGPAQRFVCLGRWQMCQTSTREQATGRGKNF